MKIVFALLLSLSLASGATYFVSPTGNDDTGDGSIGSPWEHLSKLNSMSPGDVGYLRGGVYNCKENPMLNYFEPVNSGTALNPIIVSNYPGEVPTFKDQTNRAHQVIGWTSKNYIKIFGLVITNCSDPIQGIQTTNCEFGYLTVVWRGSTPFGNLNGDNYLMRLTTNSCLNWIHDSTFSQCMIGDPNTPVDDEGGTGSPTYALVVGYYASAECNSNLIERCHINNAGHDVLTLGGNHNVVRSNWLYNAGWYRRSNYTDLWAGNRCIESVGSPQYASYPQARNLFEHNRIGPTGWVLDKGSAGHTIVDSHNIIRFNQYIGCNNFGIQLYDKTYSTPRTNCIYNNTFVYTGWCPERVTNTTTDAIITDNYAYRANVHVANVPTPGDKIKNCIFWRGFGRTANGSTTNAVTWQVPASVPQFSNNFTNTETALFLNAGTPWYDNYNQDTTISETVPDLHIGTGGTNALVDQGAFLTTITSDSGSGSSFTVADPNFFCDGWNIPNVTGDTIQLQGQTTTRTITAVNYDTGAITVNGSLTWTNGQGIALAYIGTAPDIGAYEYNPTPATVTLRANSVRIYGTVGTRN